MDTPQPTQYRRDSVENEEDPDSGPNNDVEQKQLRQRLLEMIAHSEMTRKSAPR